MSIRQVGVTGSGPNQLNVPVFAIQPPNYDIMIVDQGNNRVIEVDKITKAIDWSYGPTSGQGSLRRHHQRSSSRRHAWLLGGAANHLPFHLFPSSMSTPA